MFLAAEAQRNLYIPGFRFVPTRKNRRRWKLKNEIRQSLRKLIRSNGQTSESSKNLLGLMISSNKVQGEAERDVDIQSLEILRYYSKKTSSSVLSLWVWGKGVCRPEFGGGGGEDGAVLAMILQRFSFTISRNYIHAPISLASMYPQYAAHIMFQKILL
ncbi:hypothetical protein ACLOJK_041077 [Asimina triloba]